MSTIETARSSVGQDKSFSAIRFSGFDWLGSSASTALRLSGVGTLALEVPAHRDSQVIDEESEKGLPNATLKSLSN
jgi:hypothetical protein